MSKDVFYRYLDKILLAAILGGAGVWGAKVTTASSDRVADKLEEIRVTLAVAVYDVSEMKIASTALKAEVTDLRARLSALEAARKTR